MTDREKELTEALNGLVQKVEREYEARRLHEAAKMAYLTDYDAGRTTVRELRATLRAAERRVLHDEDLTDDAFVEAKRVQGASSHNQLEEAA